MKPSTDPHYAAFVELPVEWNHLDAFQHVNNTHFVRWFESARVAYLQVADLIDLMQAEPLGPILASVTCHYRRPVNFPDQILVGARLTKRGRSSLTIEHGVFSRQQQCLVADGYSVVVLFDYERNRPAAMPTEVLQRIDRCEQNRQSWESV